MIYLASPYSSGADKELRLRRFEEALFCTAALIRKGHKVVSPVVHGHILANRCDLPAGFDFWREYDEAWINDCKCVMVLKAQGWKESVGVTGEIQYAKRMGYPVYYLNPISYELEDAEA